MANGQPALAIYQLEPDGAYHAHAVLVPTVTRTGIARMVSFVNPDLFGSFGLPQKYRAVDAAAGAGPGDPVVGRLRRERELLESAVSYALTEAALVTPQLLSSPTPCPGWDLETLLDHVVDSIRVLHEAIATGGVSAAAAPGDSRPRPDPVARLRSQTAGLLAADAARRIGRSAQSPSVIVS